MLPSEVHIDEGGLGERRTKQHKTNEKQSGEASKEKASGNYSHTPSLTIRTMS
jgi:hypothetical protein